MKFAVRSAVVMAGLLAAVQPAFAGMPMTTINEMGKLRFATISFFVFVFFVVTLAIWGLWALLRRDFPQLPKLSIWRAALLNLVMGFAFSLILTMISGARELLTPGAWRPRTDAPTYELPADATTRESVRIARRTQIENLYRTLRDYAAAHGGQLPPRNHGPRNPRQSH